jgi:hypothetical protein
LECGTLLPLFERSRQALSKAAASRRTPSRFALPFILVSCTSRHHRALRHSDERSASFLLSSCAKYKKETQMKSTRKSAVTFAGAGALAILLASSAFADSGSGRGAQLNDAQRQTSRPQTAADLRDSNGNAQYDRRDSTDSRGGIQSGRGSGSNGSHRDNERVTTAGKVSSFSRERDGYRVRLDRGNESYWVPSSRLRNGGRDLRVGVSISLGGIFRGGMINVDAVSWPGDNGVYNRGGYDQGLVRGVVDRVDSRTGALRLRDAATGRLIDVDMRSTARGSRVDLNDLRRGDTVTLSGEWLRGNVFSAYRIDSVNTRRR